MRKLAPAPPQLNPRQPALRRGTRTDWLVAVALVAAGVLLYLPSLSAEFVELDDPMYVTDNPDVQRGLSPAGVVWAFTTTHFANWLPVTWLSHMTDVSLYGLKPAGHHATSALLHGVNAALVYFLFRRLTGWRTRSAVAAVLFLVHPLRVESVTWIAERKDVLAGTFFLLALLAYVRYARAPSAGRYLVVALCYALGLMSKTMLVTLPGVLLLLDWSPLGRVRWRRETTPAGNAAPDPAVAPWVDPSDPPPAAALRPPSWLLIEKLPLLAMAMISSAWTLILQREFGAMELGFGLSPGQRLGNALVSVSRYLDKMVRPVGLSAFYPHPGSWPAWTVAASAALVGALTLAVLTWRVRRTMPYFTVSWLWFLGMLVPVSGIVQAGAQAMADRYTYLSAIGLTAAVVWAGADAARRIPQSRVLLAGAVCAVATVFAWLSWTQQYTWQTTAAVCENALEVDEKNWLAHGMLGRLYSAAGEETAAIEHHRRCIELAPTHPNAYLYLGYSLRRLGRNDEALEALRRGARLAPKMAEMRTLLGAALSAKKQFDAADTEFDASRRLDPDDPNLYFYWGQSRLDRGDRAAAAQMFREALRLDPKHAGAAAALRTLDAPPAPGQ